MSCSARRHRCQIPAIRASLPTLAAFPRFPLGRIPSSVVRDFYCQSTEQHKAFRQELQDSLAIHRTSAVYPLSTADFHCAVHSVVHRIWGLPQVLQVSAVPGPPQGGIRAASCDQFVVRAAFLDPAVSHHEHPGFPAAGGWPALRPNWQREQRRFRASQATVVDAREFKVRQNEWKAPMTPEHAAIATRNRNRARLRTVTAAAGLASVLTAAGVTYTLPGSAHATASSIASSSSSTHASTGSAKSGSAQSSSAKSGSGTSKSSGLKSSAAPSASSGSGDVTSGGS